MPDCRMHGRTGAAPKHRLTAWRGSDVALRDPLCDGPLPHAGVVLVRSTCVVWGSAYGAAGPAHTINVARRAVRAGSRGRRHWRSSWLPCHPTRLSSISTRSFLFDGGHGLLPEPR